MRNLSQKWDKTKHGLLELGEILILAFGSLGLRFEKKKSFLGFQLFKQEKEKKKRRNPGMEFCM